MKNTNKNWSHMWNTPSEWIKIGWIQQTAFKTGNFIFWPFKDTGYILLLVRGRRGHDHMVVGFTTTYAISSNPVHGKVYSIQHYVIKFVSDFRQVFSEYCGFLHWLPRYSWNIVESGIKHHKPTNYCYLYMTY